MARWGLVLTCSFRMRGFALGTVVTLTLCTEYGGTFLLPFELFADPRFLQFNFNI